MRKLVVPLAMAAVLFVAAPAAAANAHCGCTDSGSYPPTTTTTQPPPTAVVFTDPNPIVIGTTFSFEECGFKANTLTTYTFNGTHYGNIWVGADGCYSITIAAFDPHVTINGGPLTPANWQDNVILVSGTGSNNGTRTYTLVFNIAQGATPGVTTTTAAGGGQNPSGPGTTTLAFTGFDALAAALAGLALLAAGTVLVRFTRRRNQAAGPSDTPTA
jgi:hypothetical protein